MTETEALADKLRRNDIPFTEGVKVVGRPVRSPANAEKIAIIKDLLDQVDESEVDKFFLDNLVIAGGVGFRFKKGGADLLQDIERKHRTSAR